MRLNADFYPRVVIRPDERGQFEDFLRRWAA